MAKFVLHAFSCCNYAYIYWVPYYGMFVPVQVVAMAHVRAVYSNHEEKLVRCLPMDDTLFITKLSTHRLLPGDTRSKIEKLPTQSDKASYFLNHVIITALDIEDISNFDQLLSIMQDCDYNYLQNLATTIKSEIGKPNEVKSQSGKHTI